MRTSEQIAAAISQQNQSYASQAAYSQQLSAQLPGQYQGGAGGGGGFDYGGSFRFNYDAGTQVANTATSALGGAATVGLGAASLGAGVFGGAGVNMALDPFSGAMGGYGLGGRMGMGMAGRLGMGALGAMPAVGVLAGGTHAIGSMMSGAQQQAGVEQALGQFHFQNPATPSGTGFSRQQSKAIGDMMREMQSIPDMMTDMGELTRIMDKMGQMDLMQGVRSVKEFKDKFKENIDTLKEISKVMGSTMEEALPMFGEIRRSGFYSTGDILKNAAQRQVTGGLTGMSQGQVGQLTNAGAQMSFMTGGTRGTGSEHALRVAGQIGTAKQLGILSGDEILEMTGKEGSAGVQALAGGLTQASYKMSRGALGTAMTLALGAQEEGRYTGDMDEDLVQAFRRGDFSKSDLMQMARRKSSSRSAKLSYVAQRKQMRSEMAGSMGVEGQLQMLSNVLGERGFNNEDALSIVSQRFGLSERQANMMVEMGKKMPDLRVEMKQRGQALAQQKAQESFMRENYSWEAVKEKAGKRIENVLTEPFRKMGSDIRDAVADSVDEFVDDITGRYQTRVSSGMSDLIEKAQLNTKGARGRFRRVMDRGQALEGGLGGALGMGQDMTGSFLSDTANFLTGRTGAGESMSGLLGMMGDEYRNSVAVGFGTKDKLLRQGHTILDTGRDSSGRVAFQTTTRDQVRDAAANLRALGRGEKTDVFDRMDPAFATYWKEEGQQLERDFGYVARYGDLEGLEGAEKLQAISKQMKQRGMRRSGEDSAWNKAVERFGDETALLSYLSRESGASAGIGSIFSKAGGDLGRFLGSGGTKRLAEHREELGKEIAGSIGDESFVALRESLDSTAGSALSSLVFGGKGGVGALAGSTADLGGEVVAKGSNVGPIGLGTIKSGGVSKDRLIEIAQKEGQGVELTKKEKELKEKHRNAYDGVKSEYIVRGAVDQVMNDKALTDTQKDHLRRHGVDPATFNKKRAQAVSTMLDEASEGGQDIANKIREYAATSDFEAASVVSERFVKEGQLISERVDAAKTDESLSEEARSLVGKIGALGERFEGADTDAGLESLVTGFGGPLGAVARRLGLKGGTAAESYGVLAEQISGLDSISERQRLARLGGSGLEAAVGRYRATMKRGKGAKSLADMGFTPEDIGKEHYARLRGIVMSDDEAGINDEELRRIARYTAGKQGQDIISAEGTQQSSDLASPAEMAQHLDSFSENTQKLAAIVSAMDKGE